jgi:hypothetical protein
MSAETPKDTESMQEELTAMYAKLGNNQLRRHARDFWLQRAKKQNSQMLSDPLVHEHTAVKQYMSWHSEQGMRLPAFMRDTARCVARQ